MIPKLNVKDGIRVDQPETETNQQDDTPNILERTKTYVNAKGQYLESKVDIREFVTEFLKELDNE